MSVGMNVFCFTFKRYIILEKKNRSKSYEYRPSCSINVSS